MSLAIESGASNTVAIYLNNSNDHKNIKRYHFGPANFKLLKSTQLESFLNDIKNTTCKHEINRLAIGMPGVIAEQDKKVIIYETSLLFINSNQFMIIFVRLSNFFLKLFNCLSF